MNQNTILTYKIYHEGGERVLKKFLTRVFLIFSTNCSRFARLNFCTHGLKTRNDNSCSYLLQMFNEKRIVIPLISAPLNPPLTLIEYLFSFFFVLFYLFFFSSLTTSVYILTSVLFAVVVDFFDRESRNAVNQYKINVLYNQSFLFISNDSSIY